MSPCLLTGVTRGASHYWLLQMKTVRAVVIFDMTFKFFDILPIEKWGLCPLLSNLGWFVTALTNRLGQKCAVDFKGG